MHWSAMTWGGHWRQRIGVEIFKGVARCVERAASRGRVGGGSATGRTQEWDPHCSNCPLTGGEASRDWRR